jgi:hypothetical protein
MLGDLWCEFSCGFWGSAGWWGGGVRARSGSRLDLGYPFGFFGFFFDVRFAFGNAPPLDPRGSRGLFT